MPVATGNMIYFYSNDGTYLESYHGLGDYAVIETGLIETGSGDIFTYSGEKKFIGFASSANATSPTYPIGSTITLSGSDISLYIVEEEKEPKVTISYNENVIASLGAGQSATLQCNGKKMVGDVKVTAPEVVDNPLPIEISTADEMNALLETAEVGSVYKYTGETTETYENGALYVVEEGATTYNVVVKNSSEVNSGSLQDTYIKFDTPPTSADDYTYKSSSTLADGAVLGETQATKAYIWGMWCYVNGVYKELSGSNYTYNNAYEITLTQDSTILLCYDAD